MIDKVDYTDPNDVKNRIVHAKQEGNNELALGILISYKNHRIGNINTLQNQRLLGRLEAKLRKADALGEISDLAIENKVDYLYEEHRDWNDGSIGLYLEVLREYKEDLDAGKVVGDKIKYPMGVGRKIKCDDKLTTKDKKILSEEGLNLTRKIVSNIEKRQPFTFHIDYTNYNKLKELDYYFEKKGVIYHLEELKEKLKQLKKEN